MLSYSVNKFV